MKYEEVYEAFSFEELEYICTTNPNKIIEKYGLTVGGPSNNAYAFKNNGSRILSVAHMDYVAKGNHFGVLKLSDETLVFNARLDDRLGAYTILCLLPKLGINVDVLLTDDEESCNSSAQHFETDHRYNWMVEFDRAGDDVVTYQYTDRKWEKALNKHFRKIGHGSYSDICDLHELKCCGVNVGVAYEDNHSSRAFFVLEDYIRQIVRFCNFHRAFHKKRFKSSAGGHARWSSYGGGYGYRYSDSYYKKKYTEPSVVIDMDDGNKVTPSEYNEWFACPTCYCEFQRHDAVTHQDMIECPYCGEVMYLDEARETRYWLHSSAVQDDAEPALGID